ncbi:MAG: cytochrome-c peroxidase [Bacteroidia bacterium]
MSFCKPARKSIAFWLGTPFPLRCLIGLIVLLAACGSDANLQADVNYTDAMELRYATTLDSCIASLESLADPQHKPRAKASLARARAFFKYAEPILAFTDEDNYKSLNQSNFIKIEEEDATDIKINMPWGFQVLEEQLYSDSLDWTAMYENAQLTQGRLTLIRANASLKHLKPYHVLWIIQKAFARITLTGISGFDSPVLNASLEESALVLESLQSYVEICQGLFSDKALADAWQSQLQAAIDVLRAGDFDSFDRYHFIQNHIHPLLRLWNKTVTDWNVSFPFAMALSNDASSFFSANTFNTGFFADPLSGALTLEKAALGKRLFNDVQLSASQTMSCATCHKKELAFTDGLQRSKGQNRNSPSLTYAGFQKRFFHDGRAGSLEGQIVSVVNNENEFHSDLNNLVKAVKNDPSYTNIFDSLYMRGVTDLSIRNAIASYIRTLAPFNSPFDENINGKAANLKEEVIAGFNVFMGKAACATCHFPPTFNGTVPPDFSESELEVIGVPIIPDTTSAEIDSDLGAWNLYKTPGREYFFKIPSLRNVARTAPYMHNGVFHSLEEVVDFYNRGGGHGIGIQLKNQTLSPDPLGLTREEQASLVAFMKALTDGDY